MTKKWNPLLDRLLVKRDPPLNLHPVSGLTLSFEEQENTRPHTGIIVAVGPGQWVNGVFCPVGLSEGQHVLFAHPDTLTKVDDERGELLLMREQDVFLVLAHHTYKAAPRVKGGRPYLPEESFGPEDAGALGPMHAQGGIPPKAMLFSIDRVWAVERENVLYFTLAQDGRNTYKPVSHDRFITSNGFIFSVSNSDSAAAITVIPERVEELPSLFASLSRHAKERIMLAYVGPKL